MTHPLDRPVWNALNTGWASLATVTGDAVRLDPRYGPFAAARDRSAEAQAALAATLQGRDDAIYVLEANGWPAPPGTRVVQQADVIQMIADGPRPAPAMEPHDDPRAVLLGDDDAAEMAALAAETRPGPWGPLTHRYGTFHGIRIDGELAAMAGERMRLPGLAEVSGVATAPRFQGQGLARGLIVRVVDGFRQRGDSPFLHGWADRPGPRRIYEQLGFRLRASLMLTVLALA